jgi:uncharacterized membrane protein
LPEIADQEVDMNQLIVVGFDHLDDARSALKRLRELESNGQIRFEDTAIVERGSDGTAHVHNEVSGTTETATLVGAVLGGVVTFMFPPLGAALGAAAGAAVGASLGRGVSRDFVNEVKDSLKPGRSALFLVVKETQADGAIAALRPFSGEVIQTTLSEESEEALREALR